MKYYIAAFLGLSLLGCSSNKPKTTGTDKSSLALSVGGMDVTLGEFDYLYKKNHLKESDAYSEGSIKAYLDSYIKFKLKVAEAFDNKMEQSPEFVSELAYYQKQLSAPYLTEKSVSDRLVKEAYEHMKQEVRASHILIKVDLDADPQDSLAAYKKALEIRKKIADGQDFAQAAVENSDDPSAKSNKGDLGYFSAFQMVYPVESAAYSLKPGDVSMPVRTRFGYHLMKVKDRRPNRGRVKVAHIMVRGGEGMTEKEDLAAKAKIEEIAAKLKAGEDWATLCSQFSEDNSSKSRNGELEWVSSGSMLESFEDGAFALQNVGQISDPVKSPYGWHLIKLLEKQGLLPFDAMKEELSQKTQNDSRSELNKIAFVNRVKKESNFKAFPAVKDKMMAAFDSTLLTSEWKYKGAEELLYETIFSFSDKKITANDFAVFAKQKQRYQEEQTVSSYAKYLYEEFENEEVSKYEERHLLEKYDDFRFLLGEYREGILLFKIMDDSVWSKAMTDTLGLEAFYAKNKNKYVWGERLRADIFSLASKDLLPAVKKLTQDTIFPVATNYDVLEFGENTSEFGENFSFFLNNIIEDFKKDTTMVFTATFSKRASESQAVHDERILKITEYLKAFGIPANSLKTVQDGKPASDGKVAFSAQTRSMSKVMQTLNEEKPLNVQLTSGLFEKNDMPVLSQAAWKTGEQEVERGDGRFYYIIVKETRPSEPKLLTETKGQVISDYQEALEKNWVENLAKKHKVNINQAHINSLIKK